MAKTISQIEGQPSAYPDTPFPMSLEAQLLDPGMIWHRLEQWMAWRWQVRSVVWTVDGVGEWKPPLTPAEVTTVERWAGAWVAVSPPASPFGGYILPHGTYRVTASVGSTDAPPPAVQEAFVRLAEYMAAETHIAGAATVSETEGSLSRMVRRSADWKAMAGHNSGAFDLLRPYRRA